MNPHLQRGATLYDLGRYPEAIYELNLARTSEPGNPQPLNLLAWCYHDTRDFRSALKYAGMALNVDPYSISAFHVSASAQYVLGKHKESEESIRQALAIDPTYAHNHYMVAWKRSNERKWKDALAAIENALAYDPENSVYLQKQAEILTKLGRRQEAKQASLQALALDPEDARSMANLGTIHRQDGNVAESIRTLRDALRTNPNDERARRELLQAIRSRFFLYRWLLTIAETIGRYTPKIAGPYLYLMFQAFRVITTNKDMPQPVRVVGIVVVCLIVSFFFLLVFIGVLLDAMASFDKDLSLTLTRGQRAFARTCLGFFVGSLVMTGVCLAVPTDGVALATGLTWLGFLVSSLFYRVAYKGR